ncbi:uncharacterized protein [Linepithema humile]|uniref:uncharacterized protein isoform X3 n=1 Tax=Linepithema humile TaxID=83485 RepID=UPI00351F39D2
MSQVIYNKKTRTARASQLQLTKMVDYFYLNKGLAEGKFHALHGKEEAQEKWTELANELNSFQGATKTVEQWQVVWRDLKSRTSLKVKELRKAKRLTGNKAIAQPELTEFEQRIIGIIEAEYVEGSKYCADSIPDEENLLEELEHGNNSVLSEIPQVISVCTNIPHEISQDSQYVNGHNEIENSDTHIQNQNNQNLANYESRKASKTVTSLKTNRNTPYLPTSKAKQSNSSSQNINLPISSNRANRVTPSALYSSKEHFQSIAQKQADAKFMHAESAKVQAEASKMSALAMTEIAHAIQKLADTAAVQAVNDSERIRVFEKLTTILENLSPTYLNE